RGRSGRGRSGCTCVPPGPRRPRTVYRLDHARRPGFCSPAGCPRFSTSASGWPLGLLASLEEAAGEIVYVRRGSMLAARLGGKIGDADLDAAVGAGGPHVGDLAPPDEPREVALDVPRDPSGLGEIHDSVSLREDC